MQWQQMWDQILKESVQPTIFHYLWVPMFTLGWEGIYTKCGNMTPVSGTTANIVELSLPTQLVIPLKGV